MLRRITAQQFQEWRAYADLEPFDEVRADYRAASIMQAILNVHRGKGKPALKLKDCVIRFGDQDGAATPEQKLKQTRLTLDMLMAIYGHKGKKRAGK